MNRYGQRGDDHYGGDALQALFGPEAEDAAERRRKGKTASSTLIPGLSFSFVKALLRGKKSHIIRAGLGVSFVVRFGVENEGFAKKTDTGGIADIKDLFYIVNGVLTKLTRGRIGRKPDSRKRGELFDAYLEKRFPAEAESGGFSMENYNFGSCTEVRRIVPASGKPMVARCFPRRRGRKKGPEYAHISKVFSGGGVNVPDLVFSDSSNRTLGRYGFDVVVEEWVDGRYLRKEDLCADGFALLDRLAETLARMHSNMHPRPGRPWLFSLSRENFLTRMYEDREDWALRNIRKSELIAPSEGDLCAVKDFFNRQRAAIYETGPYCLVHGDMQSFNILLTGDERAPLVPIDLSNAHYGLWPWDLVPLFCSALGKDPKLLDRLLEIYRRKRGLESVDYLHRVWPYLYVWFYVRMVGSAARKYERGVQGKTTRASAEENAKKIRNGYKKALEGVRDPLF